MRYRCAAPWVSAAPVQLRGGRQPAESGWAAHADPEPARLHPACATYPAAGLSNRCDIRRCRGAARHMPALPAHLVGHDLGGNQAWATAGWRFDRVASLTVLSTPHPAALIKSLWTSKQGLLSWYMGLCQLPALPEALARRTLAKSLLDSGLPQFVDRHTNAMAGRVRSPAPSTGTAASRSHDRLSD